MTASTEVSTGDRPIDSEASRLSDDSRSALAQDYNEISSLLRQLDGSVGSFVQAMGQLNDGASNQASLATLWEAETKLIRRDIRDQQVSPTTKAASVPSENKTEHQND